MTAIAVTIEMRERWQVFADFFSVRRFLEEHFGTHRGQAATPPPPGTRPATFSRSTFISTIWYSRCHPFAKRFFRRLACYWTGQSIKRFRSKVWSDDPSGTLRHGLSLQRVCRVPLAARELSPLPKSPAVPVA
jgi:hypothetical protein